MKSLAFKSISPGAACINKFNWYCFNIIQSALKWSEQLGSRPVSGALPGPWVVVECKACQRQCGGPARPYVLDAGPQGLCVTGAGLTGATLGSGGPGYWHGPQGSDRSADLGTMSHVNRNQGLAANQVRPNCYCFLENLQMVSNSKCYLYCKLGHCHQDASTLVSTLFSYSSK